MYNGTEDENFDCTCQVQFGNEDYQVSMKTGTNNDGEEELDVEVEELSTCYLWQGNFTASYIEDLTHKTGNFKQFSIFCSMLESALVQTSDSVSLDLLTYSDLEALREQKVGKSKRVPGQPNSNLNSKRYLIMTYTVEFDRIHYPLPLPYAGKQDNTKLRTTIQELRDEIKQLRQEAKHGPHASDRPRLNQQLKEVMEERNYLYEQLEQSKRDMQSISKGTIAKEVKVMRKVVQNLENDLMKERTKYKRMMAKKSQEFDDLSEQFQQLKANERNLRVRCKSLADELAMVKHGLRSPGVRHVPRNSTGRTSRSREHSRERASPNMLMTGGSRTPSPGFGRFDPTAYVKEKQKRQQEIQSSQRRRRTPTSHPSRNRHRSISSERRLTPIEKESKSKRPPPPHRTGRRRGSQEFPGNRVKRSSSIGSTGSNRSLYSDDEKGSLSRNRRIGNLPRLSHDNQKQRRSRSRLNILSGSDVSDSEDGTMSKKIHPSSSSTKKTKTLGQPPTARQGSSPETANQSMGIADIDARLEALQRFMRANLKDS